MRDLRCYDPEYYCEVALRSNDGGFAFDLQDRRLTEEIYGVFARAAHTYGVAVLAFQFMSNHYHGLYGYASPAQIASFLAFLHGNLARLGHRHAGTCGKFWAEPKVRAVARDEASVARRLRYILGQACAAGLVDHPIQSPGASSVDAMLFGATLEGVWVDRARRCRDRLRLRAGAKSPAAYETRLALPIAVPHCWAHLSAGELREKYRGIADDAAGVARSVGPTAPGLGQSPRECLINETTSEYLDRRDRGDCEVACPLSGPGTPSPAPTDRGDGPERRRGRGPVKPKVHDGRKRRRGPPHLLAASRTQVAAYEAQYAERVAAYRAAKRGWRSRSKTRNGAVRGRPVALPPWMLLGTLPLRLAGDPWPGPRAWPPAGAA